MQIVGGESEEPDPAITPEIARLRGIAEEEGVAERVSFIGRRGRESLKYYYSAADIFVTTPWYEPFGITPVESMACGTPVVGATWAESSSPYVTAKPGYLVRPKDPDAVGERLAHLYEHPKLMSVLSRQAIRRANDLFTWHNVAGSMAAIYEEVRFWRPRGRTPGFGEAGLQRRRVLAVGPWERPPQGTQAHPAAGCLWKRSTGQCRGKSSCRN